MSGKEILQCDEPGANLLETDLPACGVLDEPRVEAPVDWPEGVVGVEVELGHGEVVWDGGQRVGADVCHGAGDNVSSAKAAVEVLK